MRDPDILVNRRIDRRSEPGARYHLLQPGGNRTDS